MIANFWSTISSDAEDHPKPRHERVAGSGDVFSEQPNVLAEVEQGGALVSKFFPHAALSSRQGRKRKGHGRFYIVNLTEGQRMRSGVLDHEYSFSLEEAEAWLATHSK